MFTCIDNDLLQLSAKGCDVSSTACVIRLETDVLLCKHTCLQYVMNTCVYNKHVNA